MAELKLADIKKEVRKMVEQQNTILSEIRESMSDAAITRKVEELLGKSLVNASPVNLPVQQVADRKKQNDHLRYILTTPPELAKEAEIKDLGLKRAMNVATGKAGGFLVEEGFIAEVQRELPDASPVRAMSRVFSGVPLKGSLPKETGTIKFAWSDENAKPAETEFEVGAINWSLHKLAGLTFISRELLDSSAIDVVALLTTMYSEQRGPFENAAFTNGSGGDRPQGFRNVAGVQTVAQSGANLNYNNLVNLLYGVKSQYRSSPRAAWQMTDANIARLAKVKDDDGRPILLQNNLMVGGQRNTTLSGNQVLGWVFQWPVVENPDMAADEIIFGDIRYAIFDTGGIEIETTMDGAGAFENHQLAIKYVDHVDGKGTIVKGFKVLTGVTDPLA